jgi:hypothetical protein
MRLLHELIRPGQEMKMRPVLGKINKEALLASLFLIITPPIKIGRGDRQSGKLPKH